MLSSIQLFAQQEANYFLSGYSTGEQSWFDDRFGLNVVSFTGGKIDVIGNQINESNFRNSSCAISDRDGNLLFYFNGKEVYHHKYDTMENGVLLTSSSFGYGLPQGSVIVPFPEHPSQYLLIYCESGWVGTVASVGMYYALIDMTENGGLGKVVDQKEPILIDTTFYGKVAVTRHANGQDFWLCMGEFYSKEIHTFLISSKGIKKSTTFNSNFRFPGSLGQAHFSPDGSKYIVCGSTGGVVDIDHVNVFDFDRCTGKLSNQQNLVTSLGGSLSIFGINISPNSEWLYLNTVDSLFQFTLKSNEVFSTQKFIAAYDGFEDPFPTKFFFGFPAPDDKLYLTTTSGSSSLHVLHKPNKIGQNCDFEQHAVQLPCIYSGTVPTSANYRLGSLDGSPCDTLGLDNHPVADFRADVETPCGTGVFLAKMVNKSYFAPETWYWDFGDGSTSTDTSPVHTYLSEGIYDVCLTVCNSNSCDTMCKPLQIGTAIGSLSADFNPRLTYWYDSLLYDFTAMEYDFPVSYSWDFGDGTTASGKFQRHRFDSAGLWQVCVVVCAGAQTDTFCQNILTGDAYGAFISGFDFRLLDSLGTVEFRDKSTALPVQWDWDFGDGNFSNERSPIHQYDSAGLYRVCLTSCNADTICDNYCLDVQIGGTTVLTSNLSRTKSFELFPNPVRDMFNVFLNSEIPNNQAYRFSLYSTTGRTVFEGKMPQNHSTWQFSLENVSNGLYFYEIKNMENRTVEVGKLLRIE